MAAACFLIVELVFLAVTQSLGGPPWTVIGAIAVLLQSFRGVRISSLAFLVPSLVWLVLSHVTGNRELFFPFSIYLASCAALRSAVSAAWLPPLGGAVIVMAFMFIRILQQASFRVLAVELVVAIAILAIVLRAGAWSGQRLANIPQVARIATIAGASSLLAYASLAL